MINNLHKHPSHVSYASPSDVAMVLHSLGLGSLIAKTDLRDAYQVIPIHPADRSFEPGLSWQGSTYGTCSYHSAWPRRLQFIMPWQKLWSGFLDLVEFTS